MVANVIVLVVVVAVGGLLARWFFWPRPAARAEINNDWQEVAASSLSVVTNANRLRRFVARPLPHAPTPATEHRVEVGSVEPAPVDPVCGMTVDRQTAVNAIVGGENVLFCSDNCRDRYVHEHSLESCHSVTAAPAR